MTDQPKVDFSSEARRRVAHIEETIKSLYEDPETQTPTAFTGVQDDLASLNDFLYVHKPLMTNYDFATAVMDLTGLEEQVRLLYVRNSGAKSFSFRSRRPIAAPRPKNEYLGRYPKDPVPAVEWKEDALIYPPNELVEPDSSRTSAALSFARRCIIDPRKDEAPPAGLILTDLEDCLIFTLRVDGPFYISRAKNCRLFVICHQFRMHECTNVDVHLFCASRPIVEDVSGIEFAPLPEKGETVYTGVYADKNCWDQIDDFKWLRPEPSPNWTVMGEEKQKETDEWFMSTDSRMAGEIETAEDRRFWLDLTLPKR